MSLNDELLKDLDSDSNSDNESEIEEVPKVENESNGAASKPKDHNQDENGDLPMEGVESQLNDLISSGKDVSTGDLLSRIDTSTILDITKISKISHKIGPILDKIQQYKSQPVSKKQEYDFLIGVNDLSVEITNEISLVHDFIKAHYRRRFPELESLIPNALEYARIVKTLGNDLNISQDQLSFTSKEKVLVLTMSVIQAKDNTQELTPFELQKVIAGCDLLLELEASRKDITEYVASRLSVFAPNLAAIVGSYTASQFMSVLGGLKGLSQTPSCNIPSLGNKRAVGIGFGQSGVRQQGILFYSDLIQSVDPDIRKQAMRIVSGKIILAARIDFSSSVPDGSQGQKWRREIDEKIDKLQEPPENKATKALPAPIDKTSKKRAGRKYRKMRERAQSSELRKAQNRMEFGKLENSVTDGFGEEIGLGMSGSLSGIAINSNTNAKVSKAMKNRLERATENSEQFNMAVLNFGNTNEPKSVKDGRNTKRIKR